MKKKTWDLYAPIYKRAMKADQKVYDYMYARIPEVIRGKEIMARITLMYAECVTEKSCEQYQ